MKSYQKHDEVEKIFKSIPIPKIDVTEKVMGRITRKKNYHYKIQNFNKKRIVQLTTSFIVIMLFVSIRFSPTFASFIGNLPGIRDIKSLPFFDKGVIEAIDNGLAQPVNSSDEHEDIVFSVNNIIVDESRIILTYTIDFPQEGRNVSLLNVNFFDKEGNKLNIYSDYTFNGNQYLTGKTIGHQNFTFDSSVTLPDKLFLTVYLMEGYRNVSEPITFLNSEWKVSANIDEKKFAGEKEIYNINNSIKISDQNVMFDTLTIFPTRSKLSIRYDKFNTKKILFFEDLMLINENGEVYGLLYPEVELQHSSDEKLDLYFQSSYYDEYKELYLVGSTIRAIDKKYKDIVLDIKNKKVLGSLDDGMKLKDVEKDEDTLTLCFLFKEELSIKYDYYDNVVGESIIDFQDQGLIIEKVIVKRTKDLLYQTEVSYTFKVLENFEDTLKLEIHNYPKKLKDSFRVKVK